MPPSTAVLDRIRRVGTVTEMTEVPRDICEEFLEIYQAAFAPLARRAAARQALNDEEFLAEMVDPSVIKFVGRDHAGRVCAIALMATDLSVVPWISPAYYEVRYPEQFARQAVYYFNALLVRPDCQGGPWATLMLEQLTARLTADRAVGAFDCCAFNVDTARLPELIARIGHRQSILQTHELDAQTYFAYVYSGPR